MASESGTGQTVKLRFCGVADSIIDLLVKLKSVWKDTTIVRKSRVNVSEAARLYPEYHETRGTLWEAGGTTLQA